MIWSSNPILVHIHRQNYNSKRYMHPRVHCRTIHNGQDNETTKTSISRCMDKEDVAYTHTHTHTHTHTGILFSHKKEWNDAICSNMDGPRDHYTKWSKSGRERQIWVHLYMKSKIWHKWIYPWNRLTDIENKLVIAKGEGCERGMDWEPGISRHILLHIGWTMKSYYISRKYHGNYIQYSNKL